MLVDAEYSRALESAKVLDQDTLAVLWVAIIIDVIPWRHVARQHLGTLGNPWRLS
ncbi:MAG: hypothetical protein ABIQ61_10720 [Ornithinibacter sp.]